MLVFEFFKIIYIYIILINVVMCVIKEDVFLSYFYRGNSEGRVRYFFGIDLCFLNFY